MSAPKRPASPPDSVTATLVTGPAGDEDPPDTVEVTLDEDDAPGATAFVRLDGPDGQQRPRKEPAPAAPRKGLQVSLPDDEPAPAPLPRSVAQPAPDRKGRRGAWW